MQRIAAYDVSDDGHVDVYQAIEAVGNDLLWITTVESLASIVPAEGWIDDLGALKERGATGIVIDCDTRMDNPDLGIPHSSPWCAPQDDEGNARRGGYTKEKIGGEYRGDCLAN